MSIVFPRPPPTYNTLSPAQRSQLLRSTSKLGQLLGSTPHIIDESLPKCIPPQRRGSLEYGRRSQSSASRSSTSSRGSSSSESVSSDSHASTSTAASQPRSQHPDDGHNEKAWRARFPARRPPMLRVGRRGSPSLETIPASPPIAVGTPIDSPPSPSFAIPSAATARRQKMQRLAKRLGEGVPMHLVFPPTDESDDDEDSDGGVFIDFDAPTHYAACRSVESVASFTEREFRERSEKAPLWERHTSRRSKFAKSTVVSGKYVVHYSGGADEGVHGEETFLGGGCPRFAPIPEGKAC